MTIEWRVICRGLEPRYFYGANGRNAASTYARARHHLNPITWWRENHGRGTGPWIDLTNRDPNTIEAAS